MGSVLIVDDDDDVRTSLREVIEDAGHLVYEAANGREALDRLATCKPELVLLDMMMPVMGGAELLRLLREDGRVPDLPVVVVTAQPRASGMEGARVLINKPVSIDRLTAVVRTFVSN